MSVAIRLARGGQKKRPYYRIVATDKRNPRDGRFIEKLGTYNPMLPKDDPNRVTLVEDRIRYWLGNGAQPSERVHAFLHKAGIVDAALDVSHRPQKARRKADKKTRAELRAEAEAEAKAQAEEEAKAAAETQANEAGGAAESAQGGEEAAPEEDKA